MSLLFIYHFFFTASLKNNLISLDLFYSKLEAASAFKTSFFEIYHRHEIKIDDTFIMIPGYSNFQAIRKGDVLAISNKCDIKASRSSLMFMPLYQDQGDDGFFFIRKIHISIYVAFGSIPQMAFRLDFTISAWRKLA